MVLPRLRLRVCLLLVMQSSCIGGNGLLLSQRSGDVKGNQSASLHSDMTGNQRRQLVSESADGVALLTG